MHTLGLKQRSFSLKCCLLFATQHKSGLGTFQGRRLTHSDIQHKRSEKNELILERSPNQNTYTFKNIYTKSSLSLNLRKFIFQQMLAHRQPYSTSISSKAD